MPPSSTIRGSRVRSQAERLVQLLDRKRRVGVHVADSPASRARLARRDERRRRVELGHQAVERRRCRLACDITSPVVFLELGFRHDRAHLEDRDHRQEAHEQEEAAPGTGRSCRRTWRSPSASGSTCPRTTGRKSRCRLVTMMTKRSSHMPTLTTSDSTKSSAMLSRTLAEPEQLDHQHVAGDERPVEERVRPGRCGCSIMYASYGLPLYQAKKISIGVAVGDDQAGDEHDLAPCCRGAAW